MPDLKPANENPWYVLATLYGEQDGEEIDWELHEKNRRAWNAWAGSALNMEILRTFAETSGVRESELRLFPRLKMEIEELFRHEMRRRNGKEFIIPDFPNPRQDIDLSKTAFSCAAIWGKIVFSAPTSFHSSTFSAKTSFKSVRFIAKTDFNSAMFFADTDFRSTTFNADTDFRSTTFNADSDFRSATFSAVTYFRFTTFSANASFRFATFNADTNFRSATFSACTNFSFATFGGLARFIDAKFGHPSDTDREEGVCRILFEDAVFEKPINFRGARFYSHYPDLTGAVLHENVVLLAESDYWPQITQNAPEQAKASCEALRHVVAKQGQVEAERFFFNREMQFTSEVEAKKLQKRFGRFWRLVSPHWWYGFISDFGQSIFRPAAALFCVWLAGVVCFLANYEWQKSMAGQDYSAGLPWGLSFTNLFSFLGMGRRFFGTDFYVNLPHWMVFISGVQTILGVILLFFLGLGLRNRFRLK